jgi:hypothetical protein
MLKIDVIPASQAPPALTAHANRKDDGDQLAEARQDAKVGDWVRITPDQLPGKSITTKRHNQRKALSIRKLNVTTMVLGAHLYLQVRTDAEPQRKTPTKAK